MQEQKLRHSRTEQYSYLPVQVHTGCPYTHTRREVKDDYREDQDKQVGNKVKVQVLLEADNNL